MKLGSQTNSIVNWMYSRAVNGQPIPAFGMAVTFLSWTDRNPGTIVEVVSKKGVPVMFAATRDNVVGDEFIARPDGCKCWYKIDGKGVWREVAKNDNGRWVYTGGNGIRLGESDYYRDPSF